MLRLFNRLQGHAASLVLVDLTKIRLGRSPTGATTLKDCVLARPRSKRPRAADGKSVVVLKASDRKVATTLTSAVDGTGIIYAKVLEHLLKRSGVGVLRSVG